MIAVALVFAYDSNVCQCIGLVSALFLDYLAALEFGAIIFSSEQFKALNGLICRSYLAARK